MPPWLVSWGGCCLRGAARSLEFTEVLGASSRGQKMQHSHIQRHLVPGNFLWSLPLPAVIFIRLYLLSRM